MQASGKMKHFHGGGGGTEQLQSNGVDVLTVPTTIRSRTERRKSWLARYKCALMTSVLTVILVALSVNGQLTSWMAWALFEIHALDGFGVFLMIVLYAITTVLLIPAAILNLGAGFLYGAFNGYLVTIIGGMLGATASYYIGQNWVKDRMTKQLAGNSTFTDIQRALGNGGVGARHSFIVVLLARLPPFFPFPLFNYAFAVTEIKFQIYFWATFIGVSPATLLDSYIGSLFSSLAVLYGEGEEDCEPASIAQANYTSVSEAESPLPSNDPTEDEQLNESQNEIEQEIYSDTLYMNVENSTIPAKLTCVAKEAGTSSEQVWQITIGVVVTLAVTALLGWYAQQLLKRMAGNDSEATVRLAHPAQQQSDADGVCENTQHEEPHGQPEGVSPSRAMAQDIRASWNDLTDSATAEIALVRDEIRAMDRGNRVRTAGKQIALSLPGAGLVRLAAESVAGEIQDWRGYSINEEQECQEMQTLSPTARGQKMEPKQQDDDASTNAVEVDNYGKTPVAFQGALPTVSSSDFARSGSTQI